MKLKLNTISILIFCIVQLISVRLHSQKYKYDYELFNKDNGLPTNMIYDFDFDDQGNIWLCTQLGVTFYDRNTFTLQPQISSDNKFFSIEIDVNGNLWLYNNHSESYISTSEKLIIYDVKTKAKRSVIQTIPGAKELLQSPDDIEIWSDRNNTIFIQSRNTRQIFYYSGDSLRSTEIKNYVVPLYTNSAENNRIIYTEDNKYYNHNIVTKKSSVYENVYPAIPIIVNDEVMLKASYPFRNMVDSNTNKYKIDPAKSVLNIEGDTILKNITTNIEYSTINDNIIICGNDILLSYNMVTGEKYNIGKDLRNPFKNNKIRILKTYGEELWASTYNGLYKIIKTTPIFNNAAYGDIKNVRNIQQIDEENIILATDGGIEKVNLSTGEETTLLEAYVCYGLNPIDKYRYILSFYSRDVAIWDIRESSTLEIQALRTIDQFTMDSTSPFILNYRDYKGTIWLTNKEGLYKYDLDNSTVEKLPNSNEELPHYNIIIQNPNDQNKLFIGKERGLDELNILKEEIRTLSGLEGKHIADVRMDQKDSTILWISTKFNGLIKWKYNDEIIKTYTLNDGLKSMNVHSAKQDKEGNVWMSTDLGISVLDPNTDQINTFTIANGIHENEFNRHSHLSIGDSIFIYGGIDGITYFNPNKINKLFDKTTTEIKGLEYTNRITGNTEIEKNVDTESKIKLTYNQINPKLLLSSSFGKISSTVRYLFTSKNQNWQYSQNNSIPLHDLEYGENTLLISRQQSIKSWSDPKTITIIYPTPFYRNIWSYILFAAVILIAANYYQNLRSKQVEKRSLEIQKQVEEKTLELSLKNENLTKANELNNDLFEIIGHDLRSPIISLTNITKSLQYLSENGTLEETAKLGKTVDNNAKKLLSTIDKLIRWSKLKRDSEIKLENVEIKTLINDILLTYTSSLKEKKIEVDTQNITPNISVHTDYGSLRSVLKNIISNAIKFSNSNSTIIITSIQSNERTKITISDDGIGISDKQLEALKSNELLQPTKGTKGEIGLGIGIKNSIKLLDKLGSDISIQSKRPKGTIVTVTLEHNLPIELA